MSQCVPSWDLDDNPTPLNFTTSNSTNSLPPSLEYEVAELTWENGQLAMQGLCPPRVPTKPTAVSASTTTWDKPRAGGTLEAIVNQGTTAHPHPKSTLHSNVNDLVPWFDHRHALVNPAASANVTVDALVPCNNSTHVLDGNGTCMVGSCSAAPTDRKGRPARVRACCCASVSESATCGGGKDSRQVTEREFGGGGLTSTSLWSPENTSSGQEYTRTSGEDYDSICQSRSQGDAGEKGKKKGSGKLSISAKSRAAAVHNQSERKRRDKINQRMKTLQKLVPNSSKTDKASMLDEVIEYLKQLQAQIQMMSRMNMPTMMMPLPMHQHLQMSMMAPAMGMGMGMGVMDINSISRAASAVPPIIPTPTTPAFMPMGPWNMPAGDRMHAPPVMPDLLSTFLACQSQPMTIDAYSRMAAMYQQFQQPHAGSASKN